MLKNGQTLNLKIKQKDRQKPNHYHQHRPQQTQKNNEIYEKLSSFVTYKSIKHTKQTKGHKLINTRLKRNHNYIKDSFIYSDNINHGYKLKHF